MKHNKVNTAIATLRLIFSLYAKIKGSPMENKARIVNHFDKTFRLMSTMCLLIVFITIWSIVDLIDYKKNSQIFDIVIATFGIASSACWLAIWKRIENIKKFIVNDNG